MKKITKDTTLSEVLENPDARDVLLKHRVPCLGCPLAGVEMNLLTLGEICQMYGIDIKSLLTDLNKVLKEGGKEKKSL